MESALSPRDIQARIRAGASVDDIAALAGVPVERIDAFAAPVLAERDHVAGLAQANSVRRSNEAKSLRVLRTVMTEQLVSRHVDTDKVAWDSALLGNRRWRVTATFELDGEAAVAHFVYDVPGRFSVADNDLARMLIGELPQPEVAKPETEVPPPTEHAASEQPFESDDAYSEPYLTEVDGVYDIVPGDNSQNDALYDMLAGFDEDSVKIYTGLVHPEKDQEPTPVAATAVTKPEEAAETRSSPGEHPAASVPEQPTLVEDDDVPPPRKPARRQRRASVPSWDEIMFGAPKGTHDR